MHILFRHVASVTEGSLDLEVRVIAPGQKGVCHASQLKEELWLPDPDGKSMKSHMICGA